MSIKFKYNFVGEDGNNPENIFDASLENEDFLTLKMFHNEIERLRIKLDKWLSSTKSNLLSEFIDVIIDDNQDVFKIEFTNSKFFKITDSSKYIENGRNYILIEIDYVKIECNLQKNKNSNQLICYLNDSAFDLFNKNYKYFSFFDKNIWKAQNLQSDFLKFGNISFFMEFYFDSKLGENDTHIILKQPKLNFKFENLSEFDILNHLNLLCTLMSFYRNETIDFFYCQINYDNSYTIISKKKRQKSHENSKTGLFYLKSRKKLLEYLSEANVNYLLSKFQNNSLNLIINQFLLSKHLHNESRFMLLFNSLELLKRSLDKENDEFKFNEKSNKKLGESIRIYLRNLSELVDKDEKEEFEKHIITLEKTVKYKPVKEQFNIFFKKYDIELQDIDFDKVKKIRDTIFHGNVVSDVLSLKVICEKLTTLVGTLILKIIMHKK
jgi:hypothetical protein